MSKYAVYDIADTGFTKPLFVGTPDNGGMKLANGRYATKVPRPSPPSAFHLSDQGPEKEQAAMAVGPYEKVGSAGALLSYDPSGDGQHPYAYAVLPLPE